MKSGTQKGYVVVSTTVDSEGAAGKLAAQIVESRRAACVQYVRINSTYRWKGKRVMNEEYLLLCKTPARHSKALVKFIKSVHTYEVPEIVVMPIAGGHTAYLDWLDAETGEGAR